MLGGTLRDRNRTKVKDVMAVVEKEGSSWVVPIADMKKRRETMEQVLSRERSKVGHQLDVGVGWTTSVGGWDWLRRI